MSSSLLNCEVLKLNSLRENNQKFVQVLCEQLVMVNTASASKQSGLPLCLRNQLLWEDVLSLAWQSWNYFNWKAVLAWIILQSFSPIMPVKVISIVQWKGTFSPFFSEKKKKKRFHISEFPSLLWLHLQVVSHVSHYHPFNGKTSRVLEEQKKRNCSACIWEGKRGNKQLKKRYLAFKFSKAYGTDMLLSANIWKTSA